MENIIPAKADTVRLLVVEDDDIAFQLMQRAMKRLNVTFPVERRCTGEEALDYLVAESGAALPPLVLLLDIRLPGMDAFELLEYMSRDARLAGIPVHLMSSSLNEAGAARARQYANVCGYHEKSFDDSNFQTLMNLVLAEAAEHQSQL